jgi:RNAse (barnase) inhibitor barstar
MNAMTDLVNDLVHPFQRIKPQSVQAVKSFTAEQLSDAATSLGDRFAHVQFAARGPAVGGRATLKTEVLQTIGRTLDFPGHYGANLDALYDALVDMGDASDAGTVILLDRIPTGPGFDADARESLLETFRDAADTLAESSKRFRVFYSFA